MSTMIALLLATAQPANAPATPDWRPLGTARDRFELAWDAASVQRGPEVVTVTFRTRAIQSPESSPRAISRAEIRCAAAMMRVIETITYAPDGSVVRRDTVPPPFESIPPGSFVATIRDAVC
ncbi:MAG TPA: surface-adhesin E family protein [Allosphingosinicella sp.]|nr:surface-adhesin E family protein [Allosphingosinicella sp.]